MNNSNFIITSDAKFINYIIINQMIIKIILLRQIIILNCIITSDA